MDIPSKLSTAREMLANVKPDEYLVDAAISATKLYESVIADESATIGDLVAAIDGIGDMLAVADVYETRSPAWAFYALAFAIASSDTDKKIALISATVDWLGPSDVSCVVMCRAMLQSLKYTKVFDHHRENIQKLKRIINI